MPIDDYVTYQSPDKIHANLQYISLAEKEITSVFEHFKTKQKNKEPSTLYRPFKFSRLLSAELS